MSSKRYIISDASKQVDVEAHVLRYWEDELSLEIPRNEMGHRYYTEENIKLLKNIKFLKEQGFQLKAIKMLLPELIASGGANLDRILDLKEELNSKVLEEEQEKQIPQYEEERQPSFYKDLRDDVEITVTQTREVEPAQVEKISVNDDKMQQFQAIITNIVSQALIENNPLLGQELSEQVSDNVLKELNYLMRLKEEKEDERFKKLEMKQFVFIKRVVLRQQLQKKTEKNQKREEDFLEKRHDLKIIKNRKTSIY